MLLVLCLPALAAAQGASAFAGAQPSEHPVVDTEKFFAGAAAALGVHEGAHLLFDAIFDASIDVKRVHLGPVPFFAIAHEPGLPPREEFTISSAGFWTQEATAEWLLTRRPYLRGDAAPFAKGVLAFDLLTSIGYGVVAIARAGPPERDTHGMSLIGVPEPAIGTLLIVPAVLDAYRYVRPDAKWPKWASRAAKIVTVGVVIKRK
jgi:hypothetical protein